MLIEDIEREAAEEIKGSLQEVRENIAAMGREAAMQSHSRMELAMMMLKPEAAAVMNTILIFQLAERDGA